MQHQTSLENLENSFQNLRLETPVLSRQTSNSSLTRKSSLQSTDKAKSADFRKFRTPFPKPLLNCEELIGLGIVKGHRLKSKQVIIYGGCGSAIYVDSFSVYELLNQAASFQAFASEKFISDLPKFQKQALLRTLLQLDYDTADKIKCFEIETLKRSCLQDGENTCLSFPRRQNQARRNWSKRPLKHQD